VSTGYKFQELTKNIGPVTSASFSPNEQLILTTREDQTVCSFEIVSGKEIMRFGEKSGRVISAGISPDGSLVWVLKDNQTAYLYRMANGQLVHSLKLGANACEGVGFSRNSKRLIASDQYNSINILYDVESGREVLTLNSPDYSPNGNIALSISEALTVKLYDIETGAELRSLIPNSECKVNLPYEASMNGYTDYLTSAKFSPDGEKILTTSLFDRPHLYDVSTGSESWGCECHANEHGYMFFSPDSRWIISGKSPIRIYDAATGKLIQELSAPTSHRNFGYANQLDDYHNQLIDQMDFLCLAVVSPDGEYLITSTRYSNGVATIYHIRTGEIIQMLRGHRDAIYSAVFSKDGKTVFTESWDHQSILWNISDGRPLCTRVQLEDNDWITYDEYFRFDGTSAAFEKLHVVCGLEAIRLTDVKDSLWVPGLLQQYKLGQPISKNRLPVLKLSDLKLCR
jgi:WD40 repeat protein